MATNENQEFNDQSFDDNTNQDTETKKIKFIYGQDEHNKMNGINPNDTLKKNLKTSSNPKQYQTNRVKFNEMIEMYDPGMKNRTNVPMATRSNSISDNTPSITPNKNGYYTYKPPNPYRGDNFNRGYLDQNRRHPMVEFLFAEKANLQVKKADRKTSLADDELNSYRVQRLSEIQNLNNGDHKELIADKVGTKVLPKNPDDRFYFEYNKFIDKNLDDLAENIVLPLKTAHLKTNEAKDFHISSIPEETFTEQDPSVHKVKEFYLDEEKKKLAEEQSMYSQLIKISLDPELANTTKKGSNNTKDQPENVRINSEQTQMPDNKNNSSISLLISNSNKVLDLDSKLVKNEDAKIRLNEIKNISSNNEFNNANSNQNGIKITKNPAPIRRVVEVKTNQIKLNSFQITPQIKIQLPTNTDSKDLNIKVITSESIENKTEQMIKNSKNNNEKLQFKLEPRKAELKEYNSNSEFKVAEEISSLNDSAFYIAKEDDTLTDEEMFNRYHSMKSQQSKSRRRSSKIGDETYDRELNDIFKKIYNRHKDTVTSIPNEFTPSSNDEATLTNFKKLSKARLNFTSTINE